MYTQTSQKRIQSDILEINKCLEEKNVTNARNLLTVMLRTYDGVLLSLGTSMLPTESSIYGRNFDELKNYDHNVYSNLSIIRNKLELFDLQFSKDMGKSIMANRHQDLSAEAAVKQIRESGAFTEKDKDEALEKINLLAIIASDTSLDKNAKWKKMKPILDWVSGTSVDLGLLILGLAQRIE